MDLIHSRRSFLTGATALIVAPMIVRASSLMQIKPIYFTPYGAVDWGCEEFMIAYSIIYDHSGAISFRDFRVISHRVEMTKRLLKDPTAA